jgi:hypothetical protein
LKEKSMSIKPLMALLVVLTTLGGCAQLDAWIATNPGRNAPAVSENVKHGVDAIYINGEAAAGSRDFRNVYIAPANLANMQVIQPEGAAADGEWWVTDTEDKILQKAIADEFTAALGHDAAFYIVGNPEEAQMVIDTAVVAIHPNVTRATRATSAAGGSPGGAITVSIAVVNAVSGAVMVRVVDTRSSDNIWAFNRVENDDPAFNLIFRAWGDSIRLGLLQLQGRSKDISAPSIMIRQ